jgi:hypothetical protein
MSDLRSALERAAQSFEPTTDWLHGSLERSRKRTRSRRLTSGAVGLAVSAVSLVIVVLTLRIESDPGPSGGAALRGGVSCNRTWGEVAIDEPIPGGFLSVSASGPNDMWAVGPDEAAPLGSHTIIHHWDGAAWEHVPSPDGATGDRAVNALNDVFALAPDHAWAVGESVESPGWGTKPSRVLVEQWDGTAWRFVPAPSPFTGENQLNGVSGTAPNDIWAVGFALDEQDTAATTLTMHWDGAEWSIVATDDLRGGGSGAAFQAVEAISAEDVWAVGSQPSGALIAHWDGASWTVVKAPHPSDHAILTDLDARAPDDIWAVGWGGEDDSAASVPVIEHFDGSVWSFVELPAGPERDIIPLAVTAVATDDVWVAGWMGRTEFGGGQEIGPMLLHWDGEEWRYVDVPVTGSGMFLDISEGYRSAWLVGRAGGTYDDNGYLSGDRPLIVAGTC